MAPNYERSIFAETLETVLRPFGYTIHSLRGKPFSLDGQKIDRLEASLTILAFTALNQEELTTVTTHLKAMVYEQRMLIYAGLIAMGAQRQLIDSFLAPQRAWEIAVEVRDTTHRWLLSHRSEDDLLRRGRLLRLTGASATVVAPATPVGGIIMAEALDSYDEGVALHAVGLELDDRARLETAALCYDRALRLLGTLAPSVTATEAWRYWQAEIAVQRDQLS